MIISHKYKFIYIQTKKTAGSSIMKALRPFLDKDDVFQEKSPEQHRTALEISRAYPTEWKYYFRFTSIRHPLTRIISEYFYSQKTWGFKSFKEFLHHHHFLGTLNAPIITINDRIVVDNFIYFENLESDWKKIMMALGLGEIQLPHINASKKASPEEMYTIQDILHINKIAPKEKLIHEKLGYQWRI